VAAPLLRSRLSDGGGRGPFLRLPKVELEADTLDKVTGGSERNRSSPLWPAVSLIIKGVWVLGCEEGKWRR
jgi:hypothetical protein